MTGISRRGVLGAGAVATALTVTGGLGGGTAQAGPTPTFGFRLREIDYTPPAGGPGLVMGGYGWDRRVNSGAAERRLRAQCVQISHGSTFVVLLRVDVISIPSEVYRRIERGLVDQGLIAAGQLMLTSSHTHSGPMVGDRPDPYVLQGVTGAELDSVAEFTDIFVDTMVDLVRQTLSALYVPITLGYAEGLGFLAYHRSRTPDVPPPNDVPVLLARHADTGIPVAVLFGHACHAVCRGNDTVFDSDHCGYAAEMISSRLGIPALFFQGAAGDLDPILGRTLPMTGGGLADAVVAMVRNGAFYPLNGPITTRRRDIVLPLNVDDDGIEELRAKYEDRLDAGGHLQRHAERMITAMDAGELPRSMPMMVQVWGFAGLRIITMANEVTSAYHHMAKSLAGRQSWIMGYTNWIDGYVPSDRLLDAGGYEAGWEDDRGIAAEGYAGISYSWPAPLRPAEELVRAGITWCLEGTA
jgi:neutral ceramidase